MKAKTAKANNPRLLSVARQYYAWRKEKLVLTLLVKNEADIIIDNILFHYAKGVDHIIVTDNGSTDGTLEILKEMEEAGLVHLLEEKLYKQDEIVNKMGSIAKEKYEATLLIHCDADEFWNPVSSNNLKKSFHKLGLPAASVDRKDVLPTPKVKSERFPQQELNVVTEHLVSSDIPKDSLKTSLFLFRLPPKVIFSVKDDLKNVGIGNHNLADGHEAGVTDSIVIFHFPFKSTPRFEEKVIIAGKAMQKIKTTPETWWHWKRWYRQYKEGQLDKAIDILIPDLKKIPGLKYESFDYEERIVRPIRKKSKLRRYRKDHENTKRKGSSK